MVNFRNKKVKIAIGMGCGLILIGVLVGVMIGLARLVSFPVVLVFFVVGVWLMMRIAIKTIIFPGSTWI